MINFASLSRAAALAGLLAVSGAAPALAAPADVALLHALLSDPLPAPEPAGEPQATSSR